MNPFFSFFIILLVAVVFSQLFLRMRIPWVVALIVGGIVAGPSGLDLFEPDTTINFLASIGLVFLMFMAGLESKLSNLREHEMRWHIAVIGVLIGLLPAATGTAVVLAFGYSWEPAILMGIIFMSSAIALMIPQLQSQKIFSSNLGSVLVSSAILVDSLSLVLLSFFLQSVKDSFSPDILLIYGAIIVTIIALVRFIPKMKWLSTNEEYAEEHDLFEKELRFIIFVLIGFVAFFELAGLHAIIAAFFAGLVLSGSIQSRLTKAKLHAISYGFLVPVFFVVIGARTNIRVFGEGFDVAILAAAIVSGLILSKFIGGWLGGRITGFTNKESAFLGIAVTPQLSTALAVAFLGFDEGILSSELMASIVALIIVTATVAPIIASILGRKLTSQQITIQAAHEEQPAEQSA